MMPHPAWNFGPAAAIPLDAPRIMAIINATPDSFSDGGEHLDPAHAAAFARSAAEDGAAILDIGGESTRPGAARIPAPEQIRRVVPVIRAIRDAGVTLPISIDTTSAAVAEAALDAGAAIVNDVSAGADDPRMLALIAQRRAGVVLMHRLLPPHADSYSHAYARDPDYSADGGVVSAVRAFLARAAHHAVDAGIAPSSIVLDPGLGFGKSVAQNYSLIAHARDLASLGFPVLSAASRKSFLGAPTGRTDPRQRAHASVAVTVAHALAGIRLFRVHDVRAHADALAVVARILADSPNPTTE